LPDLLSASNVTLPESVSNSDFVNSIPSGAVNRPFPLLSLNSIATDSRLPPLGIQYPDHLPVNPPTFALTGATTKSNTTATGAKHKSSLFIIKKLPEHQTGGDDNSRSKLSTATQKGKKAGWKLSLSTLGRCRRPRCG